MGRFFNKNVESSGVEQFELVWNKNNVQRTEVWNLFWGVDSSLPQARRGLKKYACHISTECTVFLY